MSAMLPRLFDDSVFDVFDPFADFGRGHNRVFGKHASHLMKTDIRETDSSYKFSIDLPGFKKEDVSAELKDGYLTVTASQSKNCDEKKEDGRPKGEPEPHISDAELQRTADRVYRMIEDRIRRERRRLGL